MKSPRIMTSHIERLYFQYPLPVLVMAAIDNIQKKNLMAKYWFKKK